MTATDPQARGESFGARLSAEVPWLTGFLRRLGATREEAEDFGQDVLERALRYRHAFREDGNLRGWLGKAAFRVWVDGRARLATAPEVLGDADHELMATCTADPDDTEEIEQLLAKLPSVERDVLCRFHRGGESIEEISAALGMPLGTVKSHLHRARRRLAARSET